MTIAPNITIIAAIANETIEIIANAAKNKADTIIPVNNILPTTNKVAKINVAVTNIR